MNEFKKKRGELIGILLFDFVYLTEIEMH